MEMNLGEPSSIPAPTCFESLARSNPRWMEVGPSPFAAPAPIGEPSTLRLRCGPRVPRRQPSAIRRTAPRS